MNIEDMSTRKLKRKYFHYLRMVWSTQPQFERYKLDRDRKILSSYKSAAQAAHDELKHREWWMV